MVERGYMLDKEQCKRDAGKRGMPKGQTQIGLLYPFAEVLCPARLSCHELHNRVARA
jgi:hypothetical protein